MFFCQRGISYLFFLSKRPLVVKVLNFVFFFVPSYSFSIVLNNMQYSVGYHLDSTTLIWEKGTGYSFKDFTAPIDFYNPGFDMEIVRDSDFVLLMMLPVLIAVYSALVYLGDHLVESNRGHIHNPFHFAISLYRRLKGCFSSSQQSRAQVRMDQNGRTVA